MKYIAEHITKLIRLGEQKYRKSESKVIEVVLKYGSEEFKDAICQLDIRF